MSNLKAWWRSCLKLAPLTLGLSACAMVHGGEPADPSPAKQILFIGNSFTHGHFEPTLRFNAGSVTDLNGTRYGGMPGIFKQLTVEAGLNYAVHIEAVSSQSLRFHYQTKQAQIGSKAWDVVVMHDVSTLDNASPGNTAGLLQYSKLLEQFVHRGSGSTANPAAQVYLLETWPRADQLYATPNGHWAGRTVEQMGADLHAAYAQAAKEDPAIAGVLPVGDTFVLAVADGVADRNPYDGIDGGKTTLWNTDSFHASAWGSYLEALVVFGRITGQDPRAFGARCAAASGLKLSADDAVRAQQLAFKQLSK